MVAIFVILTIVAFIAVDSIVHREVNRTRPTREPMAQLAGGR